MINGYKAFCVPLGQTLPPLRMRKRNTEKEKTEILIFFVKNGEKTCCDGPHERHPSRETPRERRPTRATPREIPRERLRVRGM